MNLQFWLPVEKDYHRTIEFEESINVSLPPETQKRLTVKKKTHCAYHEVVTLCK
jgi:hypothetical protein